MYRTAGAVTKAAGQITSVCDLKKYFVRHMYKPLSKSFLAECKEAFYFTSLFFSSFIYDFVSVYRDVGH